MVKEKITFSVQMTVKEVYAFTMYHVYHSFSGILGVCLSLAALVNLIVSFDTLSDQNKTILTFVAAWFTVLEPVVMLWRARGQVKRNKAYQKPLDYQLDDSGITVSQNDETQTIAWENLKKIVKTRSQYLVYSSKIHAFVFPKKDVGAKSDALDAMILNYTQETNVKRKGVYSKRTD